MKGEGLELDLKFQFVLARNYANLGIKEKAKSVLKEMEGGNLNENKMVCFKRDWEVCESDPQIHECMNAIDAFGKVYKIKEAEAMFDKMSKKWKQLSAKHYTAMLKVYVDHKLLN
ncbi:unnamed protein product [Lactuca virosa]|uniref:Pentatricopeptide repeat-containing protein n=1 Tax=Lactuca virosa TaxID=75947 RepID=A0AAU9P6J4_9ASTR|nr:unnamed protein product [Lactuca virosa]